jgi:large subunit ribosomal protein L18
MIGKREARLRRAAQTRKRQRAQGAARLAVHRTNQHIYAQVISGDGAKVLAAASAAASLVGKRIAEKAKQLGIEQVAFDRGGYRYHGRVKALADAAREGGLKF